MKEMVNVGPILSDFATRLDLLEVIFPAPNALDVSFLFQAFICFSFSNALRVAEERAKDLEEKLKASKEARQKAEKDVAGVEDLR
jgi:hypothetical protein